MDIKHLNYIITIAKEKNISKAADKLFLSQSSLSYYLTTLEKEIGTPLFKRQRHGVEITEAGQKYVDAAQQVVDIRNRLYQEIAVGRKQRIVISASSLWGTRLFADAIPRFRAIHPEVTFKLTQAEMHYLESEIENGDVDFAFVTLSPYDKLKPTMKILREEELFFAVPAVHPYALSHPVPEASLIPGRPDTPSASVPGEAFVLEAADIPRFFSGDTFVLSRPGSANRTVADHLFSGISFEPANIMEVNGIPLTTDMVASGTGVAFVPLSGTGLHTSEIRYYPLRPRQFRYNTLFSKEKNSFSAAEKEFYQFALHIFDSPAGTG